MAWRISAKDWEACSCKMICRCTMGPAEPDQVWCSGSFFLEIQDGESDGVDLSGTKVALSMEMPHDFVSGIDKARVYYDVAVSDGQRREMDAIFHGERGGLWGGMKEAIKEWLPSKVAKITINDGESPSAEVEGAGKVTLELVKTESGERAQLTNAPVAAEFGFVTMDLALGNGSKWTDPDLRTWESLGYGAVSTVEWSG